jgi:glycosyltransferase involved in cell wall biosynthesis
MTDLAAIITAHNEGALAGISLRSLLEAVAVARDGGLSVDVLVMLDDPDPATVRAFSEVEAHGARVEQVSFADQGLVRNRAVELSTADYVAFLDGDDLWTENWLLDGHRMCASDPGRVIGHPELNWFFDNQHNLYFLPDATDPAFDPALLRTANPWDALCIAPRAAHLDHPYSERAVKEGYAYEDWHWNQETFLAGFVHRVVPETIHFKRRRRQSQFVDARAHQVLTRPSRLHAWDWWAERDHGR